MAKCNCSGQTCGCRIVAGSGISIEGAGSGRDPIVISSSGGGGGGGDGWDPGDLKDTVRTDTPAGWLECNGQTVSRAAYDDLFAAIGTRWGAGDGFSTFNVPNFTGRTRVGAGAGFALGASGGNAETTLAIGNLPSHNHVVPAHAHFMGHDHSDAHDHGFTGTETAAHSHNVTFELSRQTNTTTGGGGTRATGFGGGSGSDPQTKATTGESATHQHQVTAWGGRTDGPTPGNTGTQGATGTTSVGAGEAFSNMPPYRAVRVLIHT